MFVRHRERHRTGRIGWQFRSWSSHASLGHRQGPGGGFDPTCFWNFTGAPRPFRRVGCTRGRRRSEGGAIRVTFWGALAMMLTAGVGALFETVA